MAGPGVIAGLAFDGGSLARSDVEAGEGGHGQGVDLPVGEGLAGEGDGFCDAFGFAAHGWRKVDAGGVFYEDVKACGADGSDGEGGLLVAAIEFSGEFSVEVDLRVVVELIEDEVAGDGGGELVAVEDVAVGLVGMVMTGGGSGMGGRQASPLSSEELLAGATAGPSTAAAKCAAFGRDDKFFCLAI